MQKVNDSVINLFYDFSLYPFCLGFQANKNVVRTNQLQRRHILTIDFMLYSYTGSSASSLRYVYEYLSQLYMTCRRGQLKKERKIKNHSDIAQSTALYIIVAIKRRSELKSNRRLNSFARSISEFGSLGIAGH